MLIFSKNNRKKNIIRPVLYSYYNEGIRNESVLLFTYYKK